MSEKQKTDDKQEPRMHFLGEVHFKVAGPRAPARRDEEEVKSDV